MSAWRPRANALAQRFTTLQHDRPREAHQVYTQPSGHISSTAPQACSRRAQSLGTTSTCCSPTAGRRTLRPPRYMRHCKRLPRRRWRLQRARSHRSHASPSHRRRRSRGRTHRRRRLRTLRGWLGAVEDLAMLQVEDPSATACAAHTPAQRKSMVRTLCKRKEESEYDCSNLDWQPGQGARHAAPQPHLEPA